MNINDRGQRSHRRSEHVPRVRAFHQPPHFIHCLTTRASDRLEEGGAPTRARARARARARLTLSPSIDVRALTDLLRPMVRHLCDFSNLSLHSFVSA